VHGSKAALVPTPRGPRAPSLCAIVMAASSGEVITVPRNFVLLEELEKAEKGNTDMTISYGLVASDDTQLANWQCTILGPQNSALENRIISLLIHCGPKYPDEAPTAQFQTKVNFPFVGPDGKVDMKKAYPSWDRNGRLEKVLVSLRNLFCKGEYKKLTQPPDGTTY